MSCGLNTTSRSSKIGPSLAHSSATSFSFLCHALSMFIYVMNTADKLIRAEMNSYQKVLEKSWVRGEHDGRSFNNVGSDASLYLFRIL